MTVRTHAIAYVLRILKLVLVAIDDMESRALRIIIAQAMQGIEGPKDDRTDDGSSLQEI